MTACFLFCFLKVIIGSPSDGVLQAGDLIRKISNYDARDLSHKDALSLFKNAGSNISVAVERLVHMERIHSCITPNSTAKIVYVPIVTCWIFCRLVPIDRNGNHSRNALPFIPQPPIAGAVATPFTIAGHSGHERPQHPVRNNLCRFPPVLMSAPNANNHTNLSPHQFEVNEETHIVTEQVS